MSKSLNSIIVVTLSLIQVLPVVAATPQVIPVVGGGKGAFVGNAGNYNINQKIADQSAVMLEILKTTKGIQDQDRDYLRATLDRINTQLNELVKMKQDFMKLSQDSITNGTTPFGNYLTKANEIIAARDTVSNTIATSRLINRETLPSYDPAKAGELQATIISYGQINMNRVMEPLETLKNQIIADINAIQFRNLVTPSSQQITISEGSLDVARHSKGIRLLTEDQRQQFTTDIILKSTLSTNTIKYQSRSVELTRNLLNKVAVTYGKDEWLRLQSPDDKKAYQEVMTSITDAFFRRSYLRRKFGIRMGALQTIDYRKRAGNFEEFLNQPISSVLTLFKDQAATTQEEVIAAFENVRNYLETYDKKVTPVFGKQLEILRNKKSLAGGAAAQDYLSQNTNVLIRINSGITYLTGQRQTAIILRDLLILVLADILEEKRLIDSDILGVASLYDSKYRSSDQAKKQTGIQICQIDFTLSAETHEKQCKPLGVTSKAIMPTMMGGRSTAEIFAGMISQYQNVEKAKQQEARWKQNMLEADRLASMSDQERQEEKQKEDDLFN